MKKRFIPLLLLLITIMLCVNVPADLGNFNDYSSHSSGSHHSSSSHSSSRHSSSSYTVQGGSVGTQWDVIAIAIIFLTVGAGLFYGEIQKLIKGPNNNVIQIDPTDNTDNIIDEIKKMDSQFNYDLFSQWVKDVFTVLQLAWSNRDMSKVRSFEKEELFRQHQLQLQEYIDKGRINVLDEINIKHTYLFEYKRDNQYEYLTVFLKCSMIDYIKDEKTGEILKGVTNRPYALSYLLTFMRKKGVLTNTELSNKSTTNCPNCGAPCKVTSSGQCEYCGSIITTGDFDWVLSDIQGVKADSSFGNGGIKLYEDKKNDTFDN